MIRYMFPAALVALGLAGSATAHVVVQPAETAPGAETTLSFVVGHGCKDLPTTALRVELPATVRLVSADAEPGWTMTVEKASPASITWRGELAPHQPGEFRLRARLPTAPARIAFVAVQSCGDQVVRWDEPYPGQGPRPEHPAPTLVLAAAGEQPAANAAPAATPPGIQVKDGAFVDSAGRPLYTFNFDTMVGMSHCEGDCAQMWPPLVAPKDAKPFGDWSLVRRENGSRQWAYKTKPLYTYSKDQPGGPPTGLAAPNWKVAK